MVHCAKRLISRAKGLRKASTLAESRICSRLRGRRFRGYKFRRQYPISHYILDFYSPVLKLAIEIDGQHHQSSAVAEYDDRRSRNLQLLGIEVLRISNELLIRDVLLVEEIIHSAISRRRI